MSFVCHHFVIICVNMKLNYVVLGAKMCFWAMYEKTTQPNTQSRLLFTGGCWVSHGMITVLRGWGFFDLLTEKGISRRTACWENTLLLIPHVSQSFDHHGILLKINGNKKNLWYQIFFPIKGKIKFTISQKAFSLPTFLKRLQYRRWCLQ